MALELDLDFIYYVETHSQTPRALFSKAHAIRLAELAKVDIEVPIQDFVTIRYEDMKEVIKMARQNIEKEK